VDFIRHLFFKVLKNLKPTCQRIDLSSSGKLGDTYTILGSYRPSIDCWSLAQVFVVMIVELDSRL
jgi:hypothetical protein